MFAIPEQFVDFSHSAYSHRRSWVGDRKNKGLTLFRRSTLCPLWEPVGFTLQRLHNLIKQAHRIGSRIRHCPMEWYINLIPNTSQYWFAFHSIIFYPLIDFFCRFLLVAFLSVS